MRIKWKNCLPLSRARSLIHFQFIFSYRFSILPLTLIIVIFIRIGVWYDIHFVIYSSFCKVCLVDCSMTHSRSSHHTQTTRSDFRDVAQETVPKLFSESQPQFWFHCVLFGFIRLILLWNWFANWKLNFILHIGFTPFLVISLLRWNFSPCANLSCDRIMKTKNASFDVCFRIPFILFLFDRIKVFSID